MNGKNVIKLLDASEISPNDYSSARHRKSTLTRREFLGSALGASLAPGAVRTILGAGIARAPQPEVKGRRTLGWRAHHVAEIPRGYQLAVADVNRSEEHTSELQSLAYLVCRLLLEKKKNNKI